VRRQLGLRGPEPHVYAEAEAAHLSADAWARDITPAAVLGQIESPFAPDDRPAQELDHAA